MTSIKIKINSESEVFFLNMVPVSSSCMLAVGYTLSKQELAIQFSSDVVTHSGVPEFEYQVLMNTSSKENYYNTHIRKYPFRHGY